MIGCFSLSEPNAGSDAGSLTTFAEDKGDHWELNGVKNWITNGVEAGLPLFLLRPRKRQISKGISAFIIRRYSGYSISKSRG